MFTPTLKPLKSKKFSVGLTLLLLLCSHTYATEIANPVNISFGTLRTHAEQAAVALVVKYSEKIDEEYFVSNAKDANLNNGKGWLFEFSPEVELQTGEADSFNGLVTKLTGNYIRFNTTLVGPIEAPDNSKPFHVFPISLGLESNRNFQTNSLLVELGYIPFDLKSKWRLGIDTKIGAFIQAGYKFESDSTQVEAEGGASDQSNEDPDSELFRIKLDAGTELLSYKISSKYSISLVPRARIWFDLANSETYHKYETEVKLSLGDGKTLDFRYEDGSGAPNFNEGSQFGTYLTINY